MEKLVFFLSLFEDAAVSHHGKRAAEDGAPPAARQKGAIYHGVLRRARRGAVTNLISHI